MYFYISGSENLSINKEYKIKFHSLNMDNGELEDKVRFIDEKSVRLKLYNIEYTVELQWLYLLASTRCSMPKGFEQYITRFRFVKSYDGFVKTKNNMINGNKLPFHILFSEPIYIKPGFRLVAEFPEFAISENKQLLNIKKDEIIAYRNYTNNSYIYGRFYSRFFKEIVSRPLHVIAALTWIPNDDYVKFPIVNHLDGDKRNWSVSNLEWTDHSGNIRHAYENGLRLDNRPVKVYDSVKKEILIYHSVTEAFKSFGANPRANLDELFKERNGYYIAKNRYEIRYLSDKNDFVLKTMTVKQANAILKTVVRTNIKYQAINTKTKKEIVGGNTTIQKELKISEGAVTAICRKKTFYGDWIIREYTTEELDLSKYSKVKNAPQLIRGFNSRINKEFIFKSLREAGRESKFDPITIKRLIAGARSFSDGWTFSYIKSEEPPVSPIQLRKAQAKSASQEYFDKIAKNERREIRLNKLIAKRIDGVENDLKNFYSL